MGTPDSSGQWIWKRSIRSTASRVSEASQSRRMASGDPTRRSGARLIDSSHCMPHLVKTNGRSAAGSCFTARPTTSSEWPSP